MQSCFSSQCGTCFYALSHLANSPMAVWLLTETGPGIPYRSNCLPGVGINGVLHCAWLNGISFLSQSSLWFISSSQKTAVRQTRNQTVSKRKHWPHRLVPGSLSRSSPFFHLIPAEIYLFQRLKVSYRSQPCKTAFHFKCQLGKKADSQHFAGSGLYGLVSSCLLTQMLSLLSGY